MIDLAIDTIDERTAEEVEEVISEIFEIPHREVDIYKNKDGTATLWARHEGNFHGEMSDKMDEAYEYLERLHREGRVKGVTIAFYYLEEPDEGFTI